MKVTLASVGDIALAGNVIRKGNIINPDVASLFSDSDINIFNLEFPFTEQKQKYYFDSREEFAVLPKELERVLSVNWTIASIATNHILDWGKEGITTTIQNLKAHEIYPIGAGETIDEATKPYIIELNGISFGIWNACKEGKWSATKNRPGANVLDESLIESIKSYKKDKNLDHIIVLAHWGIEYCSYPAPFQREFAYGLIDAGASLILGSHPHTLQGIEKYRDGLIIYSQGNFFADSSIDRQPKLGAAKLAYYTGIFKVVFLKNTIIDYRFVPLLLTENGGVKCPDGYSQKKIKDHLLKISLDVKDEELFYQTALENLKQRELTAWISKFKKNKVKTVWEFVTTLKVRHLSIFINYLVLKVKK